MPVDFGRSWPQRLQIISGLILFTFVLLHFSNHALGLISVDLMLWFQEGRTFVFRSIPGSFILLAAILTHMGLVLYRVAMRASLKMPLWEWIRLGFGLSIPFLLIPHVANTRGANILNGTVDDYLYVLPNIWPDLAWEQSILLLIVWVHACMGLHYWLRINGWYRRLFMVFFSAAIALPILAIAGFSVAGPEAKERVIAKLVAEIKAQAEAQALLDGQPKKSEPSPYGGRADAAEGEGTASDKSLTPNMLEEYGRLVFFIILLTILSIFTIKYGYRKFGEHIEIDYKSVRKLRSPKGATLLEISRSNNIPHASQCGGRARCSTCRVRVLGGAEALALPGKDEAATLARIKAAPDVRLACQIRPADDLSVVQLVRPKSAEPPAKRMCFQKKMKALNAWPP